MTAFTITGTDNIDSKASKTGGDTYTINGGTLTIDQDSRYGLNQGTGTSMAAITISATLGGVVDIDARGVIWLPYTGGSGNVPAGGTTISQGGVSAKLICVASAINVAPTAAASAMPASGFIKVKQVTGGAFTTGALTAGVTATVSSAPIVAPISLVGDESATITVPRLGTFRMRGAWYAVGTTSGSRATTYQMPTQGEVFYCPGVWVETGTSTDTYEFYPCAGSLVASGSTPTDAVRGKVCWISTAGVLRFGSDGTNTVGYVPPSGRRIRVPNIFTANCTTTTRTANALPNATLATRYDFTTTGGGVLEFDTANLCWYPSFAQAFSVSLNNVGISEQLSVSELASPINWSQVGVGQCAAQAQFGLLMSLCFAGGTMTDCTWTSASLAASGRYIRSLTGISGFTFIRERSFSFVLRANNTTGNATCTRVKNCTWTNPVQGLGQVVWTTCSGIKATNVTYYDAITTTGTSFPMSVWSVGTVCSDMELDGLTFGGLTNNQPYTALLSVNAAGCDRIRLRNVGTYASKLNLGATNGVGYVVVFATGAAATNCKLQRIYVTNTRTGLWSGDNSSKDILFENVHGDTADAPVSACLNMTTRGYMGTHAMTAQTAVYGTHWFDGFTSTTAGRIGLVMNEPTADTTAQVVLTNNAAFTSAGGLYMPVIGMTATFETPDYVLGHTAFANSALVMAGGTAANYTYAYQIDKNDGSGYSAWSSELTAANLGTSLSGVTGIDASKGFKLKLRITTSTTNSTAITSVYLTTVSTTTAQAYQYPLETNTLTFTGLPTGADIVVLQAGTSTILTATDAHPGTSWSWVYAGAQTVDVGFLKPGYVPFYIRGLALGTTDTTIPVALTPDRNYA